VNDVIKIGFFLSEWKSTMGYIFADMMLRSVKRVMPGVEVVQFTDERSSILYGVDSFIRKEGKNVCRLRLEHYGSDGNWIFLDTDLIVQADVRHVFDTEFDIALVDRAGSLLPGEVGSAFMQRMPYNLGAVFSRSPMFWTAALRTFDEFSDDIKQEIIADQLAVNIAVKETAVNVKILPGMPYNLSPQKVDQDVQQAAIVHYKGNRKHWMLRQLYAELGLSI